MSSSKAELLAATHRDLLDRIRRLTEQAEAQRLKEEEEELVRVQQEEAARRVQAAALVAPQAPVSLSSRDEAVGRVRALMDELDVTVVDILASIGRLEPESAGRRPVGRPRSTAETGQARQRRVPEPYRDDPDAPVRYRDTNTGDTWTGIGRVPQWIHEYEKRGVSRDQFLVG